MVVVVLLSLVLVEAWALAPAAAASYSEIHNAQTQHCTIRVTLSVVTGLTPSLSSIWEILPLLLTNWAMRAW